MSGAPNLTQLISGYLRRVQTLEDGLTAVQRSRFLAEAEGEQLDRIGALEGAYRRGMNDSDYRTSIATQLLINTSSGTVDDLQAIFKAALGDGYTLKIISYNTHSCEFKAVLSPAVPANKVKYLRAVLRAARAGGVYGLLKTTTDAPVFRFAGGSGSPRGFGVGKFAGIG